MLTNYHTHTTRCGHAEGTEEKYILTALRCGYKVLGFSDHTPWAYATPGFVSRIRMLPSQLDDYVLTLRGLREKYADKLHIRIGLEAEYFPAYLGWLREEMERLDIEYLILGCHYDTTDEQDARASRFGGSTSTAGGIRVTTFAVILLICRAAFTGHTDINAFRRRIPTRVAMTAVSITAACLFLVLSASLALMLASDCSLTDALFDACSSFGLGGYSVGVAREDNPAALFILATAMVVGRLGPMTIAYAINRPRALESIRYPNEPIVVG